MQELYEGYWKKFEEQIKRSRRRSIVFIPVTAIGTIFIFVALARKDLYVGIVGAAFLIAGCLILNLALKDKNTVSNSYKIDIVKPYFEEQIKDLTLSVDGGITRDELKEISILREIGVSHNDTLMQGICQNIKFRQSNLKLQDSDEDSTTILFMGAFYTLELPHSVNMELTIRSRGFIAAKNKTGFFTSVGNKFYKIAGHEMYHITGSNEKLGADFLEQNPWLLSEIENLMQLSSAELLIHFSYHQMYAAINYGVDILDANYSSEYRFVDSSSRLEKNLKVIKKLTEIANHF